jgi:glycosyltransferase involved in cell wall biosynthesis
MNVLFIHQNFPGQFGRLAARLAAAGHRVVGLGEHTHIAKRATIPGVERVGYPTPRGAGERTHPYLRRLEGDVRRAQDVVRLAQRLATTGFVPDVIYGNPGWGELLFIKDVFPNAALIALYEFYFRPLEGDHGFDPLFPADLESSLQLRVRNATLQLTLDRVDHVVAPTQWQASHLPAWCAPRVSIIHDGVDTDRCRPDPAAVFRHPRLLRPLTSADEVLTFVARNLEPYRGFHRFMQALPAILQARPSAQVVIAGGDGVSYGSAPSSGACWREVMLREVGAQLDAGRVHFVGKLPYGQFVALMQVSTLHIYLTYPFVLSWSMLEAMACGALVLGSNTAPVAEVIEPGRTGLFTSFHDPVQIAHDAIAALRAREDYRAVRDAARELVAQRYDFDRVCGPAHIALVEQVAAQRA